MFLEGSAAQWRRRRQAGGGGAVGGRPPPFRRCAGRQSTPFQSSAGMTHQSRAPGPARPALPIGRRAHTAQRAWSCAFCPGVADSGAGRMGLGLRWPAGLSSVPAPARAPPGPPPAPLPKAGAGSYCHGGFTVPMDTNGAVEGEGLGCEGGRAQFAAGGALCTLPRSAPLAKRSAFACACIFLAPAGGCATLAAVARRFHPRCFPTRQPCRDSWHLVHWSWPALCAAAMRNTVSVYGAHAGLGSSGCSWRLVHLWHWPAYQQPSRQIPGRARPLLVQRRGGVEFRFVFGAAGLRRGWCMRPTHRRSGAPPVDINNASMVPAPCPCLQAACPAWATVP